MNILGLETSCDETAAAVVTDGVIARSSIIASSLKDHQAFGGIIPEIASRRQIESIAPVVSEALNKANCTINEIDAIAVTIKPGLLGSLLVGIAYARGLARALNKPLIEVNHIQAHMYANFVQLPGQEVPDFNVLPAIGLVVSGGHTSLYEITSFKKMKLLGQTRDDAAGEAFDKVARFLELGYPGGPIIDSLARKGVNNEIRFPQAQLESIYDFSFSGLKTAVLYYTRKHKDTSGFSIPKIVYAFQESVVASLVKKSLGACKKKKIKTLLVGGGVAANSRLRQLLTEEGLKQGVKVFFPPMSLCLDNGAMIAGLGYHLG